MISSHSRRAKIGIGEYDRDAGIYEVSADPVFVQRAQDRLAARGLRASHAILLIHGWRVGAGREADSYDALLANIAAMDPDIEAAVLTVAWPSKGSYWSIARTVPGAAGALAGKIASPRSAFYRTEELVIVAHSMGCAFALELCEALLAQPALPFLPRIRLFLMAAAVPISRVSPTGRLRHAAEASDRSCVYHSRFDSAFGLPFRFGEWMASRETAAEAVGEYGRPDGLWSDPVSMELFDHGDYWVSPDIAEDIVREIQGTVRRTLPRRRF